MPHTLQQPGKARGYLETTAHPVSSCPGSASGAYAAPRPVEVLVLAAGTTRGRFPVRGAATATADRPRPAIRGPHTHNLYLLPVTGAGAPLWHQGYRGDGADRVGASAVAAPRALRRESQLESATAFVPCGAITAPVSRCSRALRRDHSLSQPPFSCLAAQEQTGQLPDRSTILARTRGAGSPRSGVPEGTPRQLLTTAWGPEDSQSSAQCPLPDTLPQPQPLTLAGAQPPVHCAALDSTMLRVPAPPCGRTDPWK